MPSRPVRFPAHTMNIAQVALDIALDHLFDYSIPQRLAGSIRIGVRVSVPFGRTVRDGYVLALCDSSSRPELRDILDVSDNAASLPEKLVKLGNWIADYYCCSREQAIRTLLPAPVRRGKIRKKFLSHVTISDPEAARAFIALNLHHKRFAAQTMMLRTLLDAPEHTLPLNELLKTTAFTRSRIDTLVKRHLLLSEKRPVRRDPFAGRTVVPADELQPTTEQAAALDQIRRMLTGQDRRHVLLLHGVTNSGKTEVYLQAIAQTMKLGKSAIVLVPEISLTPQTVRRFRSRFGDQLSILHSRLSDGERFDEWHRISRHESAIAVGARSALFAPFRNLGLIVVDEEHDSSYKQSEAPRYSARDVAVMRGRLENAVVILGSATPSAESSYNASSGKYVLARLSKQISTQMTPRIRIVDQRLGGAPEQGKSSFFSSILIDAVQERLERGEQSILFLNRRGYARVMLCQKCGYEAVCPNCSVNFTYSKKRQTLSCHLCGKTIPAPRQCPTCRSSEISYNGVGTEKVEAAAAAIFTNARIARMDSDSMRSVGDYEMILERFRRAEIDILIGTQMIAKGLHFPNVTLVGVINADSGLMMPDFRAPERTFQLLTQVAGRAGRGDIRGEVIIQTYNPDNEAIKFAVMQDFDGFSRYDLEVREMLSYPPFARLIAVHFQGKDEQSVAGFAEKFTASLRQYCSVNLKISGPLPAPIERIKGKFRYMTILRGNRLQSLRPALRAMLLHGKITPGVEVYADVDAQSLL